MALQLRRKTHESVIYIDRDSAPRIIPSGEDFILEDLPIGTRVLYPKPVNQRTAEPRGRDSLRAQSPARLRSAVRTARTRHARHDRGRHQSPAAANGHA